MELVNIQRSLCRLVTGWYGALWGKGLSGVSREGWVEPVSSSELAGVCGSLGDCWFELDAGVCA
jgi:hypothetical protein